MGGMGGVGVVGGVGVGCVAGGGVLSPLVVVPVLVIGNGVVCDSFPPGLLPTVALGDAIPACRF